MSASCCETGSLRPTAPRGLARDQSRGRCAGDAAAEQETPMTPFLALVLASFAAFIATLGYVSTRDMLADARRRRAHRQIGTARRIQRMRESSMSGFSRT
jgi:hypothetical protein